MCNKREPLSPDSREFLWPIGLILFFLVGLPLIFGMILAIGGY